MSRAAYRRTPQRALVLVRVANPGKPAHPACAVARPAWGALYAIVLVVFAALFGITMLLPDGLARTGGELVSVCAGMALVWIWLRWNRTALALLPREQLELRTPDSAQYHTPERR